MNIYGSLMYAHDFHFFVTHDEPLPEPNPPGETPAYPEPMLDWGGAYASSWLQCLARPKRRREENWEGGMEWRNNRWSRRPAASSSGWHQLGQQWPYAQQWPQDQQWQDDDQQWSGQHGLLILNGLASTGVIRGGLGLSNAMVGSRNQAVPDFV